MGELVWVSAGPTVFGQEGPKYIGARTFAAAAAVDCRRRLPRAVHVSIVSVFAVVAVVVAVSADKVMWNGRSVKRPPV